MIGWQVGCRVKTTLASSARRRGRPGNCARAERSGKDDAVRIATALFHTEQLLIVQELMMLRSERIRSVWDRGSSKNVERCYATSPTTARIEATSLADASANLFPSNTAVTQLLACSFAISSSSGSRSS